MRWDRRKCLRGAEDARPARRRHTGLPALLLSVLALLLCASVAAQARTVRVGIYDNPPRLFTGSDGEPQGFWAELLKTIAEREDWQLEWVPGTWSEGLARLQAGEIDVMPDVARTAERAERMRFCEETVLTSWSRVYVRPHGGIESLLDLDGRRVGTLEGSVNVSGSGGLHELLESFGIDAELVALASYRDAFNALATGRVDAVASNKDIGNRLYPTYGAVPAPIVFQPVELHFAVSLEAASGAALREQLDTAVRTLKSDPDSVYYRLQSRWLGVRDEPEWILPFWVFWILGFFGIAVIVLLAGNFVLDARVRRRTRDLRESEERIQAILDNLPGVALRMHWVSGSAPELLATEGATFFGQGAWRLRTGHDHWDTLIHPDDRAMLTRAIDRAVSRGRPYDVEHRIRLGDDSVRWVLHLGTPTIRDGDGMRIDAFLFDITERKETEAALRHSMAELAAIHDASLDLILLVGPDGRIQSANRQFFEATGYSRGEVIGEEPGGIAGGALRAGAHLLDQVRQGTPHRYETQLTTARGATIPVEVRLRTLPGGDRPGRVLVVMRDLSSLRAIEAELRHQSTHDPLTGLPNRTAFETALEQAVLDCRTGSEQHALCYLDVDQFRVINDTAGHSAGDALLRQVAQLLHERVHHGDVLARFGGDEFTLLLRDCDLSRALEIADGHRSAIEAMHFVSDGRSFQITASIGVVPVDAYAGDAAMVLGAADAACHLAKDGGRNRVQVYDTEDTALQLYRSGMEWAQELHDALRGDRFRLLCQPIVPASGEIDGRAHYEILLRMLDQSGSTISPGVFLPIAERYGLVPRVDQWVVEHALGTIGAASDSDAHWSINLSGQSLASTELLTVIENAIHSNGIDPRRLTFEVTETAVVRNFTEALAFIERLRELGCTFALDDFGSGLSSFGYLKHLNVDVLKLDGVFIRDLLDDPRNEAMVTAFTRLAQAYELHTVAEFVSNDALRERLVQLGVDYVQGFAVGRPQPLDDVLAGRPPIIG
ncbi:hypothetical protein KBTX_00684 [wastewater metagenome]|uniref:Uncharacterized protein n=4 Tax=root TaxID=1 RepID=A0A5B8R6S0_9ZZZZ|nr:EAL domain-containing protein [Arhodomonas aquaeolei]QEA04376.1 hypothetical protein KBTEX_00684 [uncultured organism]